MSKKINETLAQLMAGILVSGVLIQAADLLVSAVYRQFARARAPFALGLWTGVLTALALSVHIYRSIDRALDMSPGDAESYMRKAYMLRTLAILLVAGAVTYFRFGYVMAYFVGVLCLKFGAFLQPLMHKFRERFRK